MSLLTLARACFRRRRLVVSLWVALLFVSVGLSRVAGSPFASTFSLPGTDSQRAFDLLEQHFPARAGDIGTIVFRSEEGVATERQRMEAAFAAAEAASPHVLAITSPYDEGGQSQIASSGEHAGEIAFAQVQFDRPSNELPDDTGEVIRAAVVDAARPDDALTIEFGGSAFSERTPPSSSEAIGLVAAACILLVAFGSVVAMGLPIVTALIAVGIGLSGVRLVAGVVEVPEFATLIAAMIGIGVGIDYALFIVTRHRESLRRGAPPEEAAVHAVATSGRAVVFAGVTVVLSLLGILFMGFSFMNGLALSAVLTVLVTVAASVTLLPALLGFAGGRIDRLSVYRRRPEGGTSNTPQAGFWWRWSRQVQRKPARYGAIGLIVLAGLALPVLDIRLGLTDAGNQPTTTTNRRAYDLLSDGFGPGYNAPLTVAARLDEPTDLATVEHLRDELAAAPGVASVTTPVPNDDDNPTAAVLQVYGEYEPQAEENDELVHRLRADVIDPIAEAAGLEVYAGGQAALGVDMADKLSGGLPVFFGTVIFLSFILLMAAFRSVLVALKAAAMNVLAIAAAFGVLVAVFQWGWGAGLIDVGKAGPIAAFAPVLAFAILFGLSMDYEVFLLSRIKEEHDRTGDNASAVADGLGHTARVITSAAAIMVTVFLSFVLNPDPTVKLIGFGLGAAILLDATLVRMVLVPATMELLGKANWWFPRWLDRRLPNVHVEGTGAPGVRRNDGGNETATEPAILADGQ